MVRATKHGHLSSPLQFNRLQQSINTIPCQQLISPSSGCKISPDSLCYQPQPGFMRQQRLRMKSQPSCFNSNPFHCQASSTNGKPRASTPTPTSVFVTKTFATQGQVGHFDPLRLVRPFRYWENSIVLKPSDKGLSAPGQRISPM